MITYQKLSTLLILSIVLIAQEGFALEVDREVMPRVTVGGRLIATPTITWNRGIAAVANKEENGIDISDSSLLLRFDKRLYDGGVAGAKIGFSKPEAESDLNDDVFFNQLHAFFWNKDIEVILGRTQLHNTIVEFPTIRDDDLLSYTHAANLSSFAGNDQYQLFGDVMSFGWYVDATSTLTVWGSTRTETDALGEKLDEFNLNTSGLSYVYQQAEELAYLKQLRHAGVLFDYQDVDGVSGDDNSWSVITGAEWNLNNDPRHNWSAAIQAIYNEGLDGATVSSANGLRRTQSSALVGSVRLTERPKLLTRCQKSITIAYKNFDDVNASQLSIIPNIVHRLGSGVDLLVQLNYTRLDDALATLAGYDSSYSVMAGLSFSFDMNFNDSIGERTSILDTEHSYIRR